MKITGADVQQSKLRRIVGNGDGVAPPNRVRLHPLERRSNEDNLWSLRSIGLQMRVCKRVSTPQQPAIFGDCRHVPPVGFHVEDRAASRVLICLGTLKWSPGVNISDGFLSRSREKGTKPGRKQSGVQSSYVEPPIPAYFHVPQREIHKLRFQSPPMDRYRRIGNVRARTRMSALQPAGRPALQRESKEYGGAPSDRGAGGQDLFDVDPLGGVVAGVAGGAVAGCSLVVARTVSSPSSDR